MNTGAPAVEEPEAIDVARPTSCDVVSEPSFPLAQAPSSAAAPRLTHGRCPTCGRKGNGWTPALVIEALHRWIAERGSAPVRKDWTLATPEHPSFNTVVLLFGNWNDLFAAAGLPARQKFAHPTRWTRERVAEAMLDWLLTHGRWPRMKDWKTGARGDKSRPCTDTVTALFGNWNAAKRYAGWRTKQELEDQWERRKRRDVVKKTRRRERRRVAAV